MSRRRKGEDKTLVSYKHVLDSMVNFLGATGALLRQRIETGQILPEIDCEAECLVCASGVMCPECTPVANSDANVPSKVCPSAKECASLRASSKAGSSTSKTAIPELEGITEEPSEIAEKEKPAATGTEGDKESSACVCSQIRAIKDSASKLGVPVKNNQETSCVCGPSDKQKNELEDIIADRLQTVSKLVDLIQVDLSNLSGQSKSAALYQEIMKERPPLSPPLGDVSRKTEYPITSSPYGGRQVARRRPCGTPGISPIPAQEVQRRTPTPTSLFSDEWSSESRPWFPTPTPPADQLANFVQCIFQKKRQRPGQTFLSNTEPPALPSHNDRRYSPPVSPMYHSLKSPGLTMSSRNDIPGSGYGYNSRVSGRSPQYSQASSASPPQISRIQGNLGNLQRARTNFAACTNLQPGTSEIQGGSGGSRAFAGYGDLQNARNQFQPLGESSSNYGLSYIDQSYMCTNNTCENEECDP